MTDILQMEITPGSSVTLHGKEYRLTLPVRAVLVFKQRTGIDLFNLGEESTRAAESTENVIALFHAMLGKNHPDVTFDEVTDLVDLGNMAAVRTAVLACIASYLPDRRKAEEEDEAPNAATVHTT